MNDLDKLFDLAKDCSDKGNEEEAIEIYKKILVKKDDWSSVHYNLGLIYKYKNDWANSYKHNLRAVELDKENESSQWNLGIAATMLKKWKIARQSWNYFGMKYDIIDKDPRGNIGVSPIRLNPDDEAEVVWATRIDPARAIIDSIPFPESNHNYGDLILNDGAPLGKRSSNGIDYSVFNELQSIEKSNYQTFSFDCNFREEKNFNLLKEKLLKNDIEFENWTSNIQMLCKACSEGKPHNKHEKIPDYSNQTMKIGLASKDEELLIEILNLWSKQTKVDFDEFYKY